jgi:glycosyltransferase involved in cell wall biosynthesis
MMGSPRASIVVRCYNEAEHIAKLLHGIEEQTMQDYEVVLVDSGSTDGTVETAENWGVDEIVYIDPENFSFGRALNYGCEEASGEFCVIVSAHVYPRRDDWLERLLEKFEDEDVALVYGKQRGNHVTTFSEKQIFKQWFPETDIDRQDHPFCNNANAAIRRDLWEECPYDEELTGLEEVDWAKRVQEAGHEISYASDAEIVHVHDETPREIFNRYRRESYAQTQIFPDREFTFVDFVKLTMSHVLKDYRTAVSEDEFVSNLVVIPQFRVLQFLGTYWGFQKEGPIPDSLWQRFYYPDRNSYPSQSNDNGENRSEGDEIEYPESDDLLEKSHS